MKKVLVIEDDKDIVSLLKIHLEDLECEVQSSENGTEGLQMALSKEYDLIILDLMLPGKDGLEVCREIRMNRKETPVLMLTAKSEEIDKVLGLETGADDYLTKPFSLREFIARVKVIFRRASKVKNQEVQQAKDKFFFGALEIHQDLRKVTLNGERVELSPKEYELLILLASHPGRSYSREQLLKLIWGYDFNGYEHTVNSHINRLRGKIEENINEPRYILTTWGVGYRFNDEV